MAKTDITKEIEIQLVNWLEDKNYEHAVTECTLGYTKQHGIVDVLSYTGKSVSRGRGRPRTREVTWKCYEIKVSKSDFYSKAKWSFIGHYNYFVIPKGLYSQIKKDVPKGIGVIEYHGMKNEVYHYSERYGKKVRKVPVFKSVKRASRGKLKMDEKELTHDFIVSANRDVRKWLNREEKTRWNIF